MPPFTEKPAKLFKTPIRVNVVGQRLVSEENSWRMISWEGPEILPNHTEDEHDWNADVESAELLRRAYFRITTACGDSLWVYRVIERGDIYVHGLFG